MVHVASLTSHVSVSILKLSDHILFNIQINKIKKLSISFLLFFEVIYKYINLIAKIFQFESKLNLIFTL